MDHDQSVSVSLEHLISLAQKAKDLPAQSRRIKSHNAGAHLSRLMARGMEFAETRRYQPGDDIRTIDWRVTARTGKPHTKLFAAEKERKVYICADLRRPMFFATQGVFKSVQAATLAAYVAWHAVHQGDRIGGVVFTENETIECRPARGKQGVLPLLQVLTEQASYSEAKMKTSSKASIEDSISHLHRIVQPGSRVFIISDFRKTDSLACDHLYNIASHSDVILCFIYDPFEESMPKDCLLPISSPSAELTIDTSDKKSRDQYASRFHARKELVASLQHHPHIHFVTCSTTEDCFEVLRA